jgi:V8-like Glu-specific endopeptidase
MSDNNVEAIKMVIEGTRKCIMFDKLDDAFNILEKHISPISRQLYTSVLLNKASLVGLNQQIINGLITQSNANVAKANIKMNLLNIMDQIPTEIEIQQMLGNLSKGIYKSTTDDNLERILGSTNHIVKINWLFKGIEKSRSVCQVIRSDGVKGTGFVLKNGYLMTNDHVIPNRDRAATSKIVFDFEEDIYGNMRKTSEFRLDPDDAVFSPVTELDYAYIKIKDNMANPLSNWGFLELDTFTDPQVGNPVNIIQHPLGQTKQIALTANKILGISDPKLLYETDTERGSSGSPVFNNDWKVIALHHAGKTEEDGGLVIDSSTGERRGANEGILIRKIVHDNNRIV